MFRKDKKPGGKRTHEARAYADAIQDACNEAREAVDELNVMKLGYAIPTEVEAIDTGELVEKYLATGKPDEALSQALDHYLDSLGSIAKLRMDRERDAHAAAIMTASAALHHLDGQIERLEKLVDTERKIIEEKEG